MEYGKKYLYVLYNTVTGKKYFGRTQNPEERYKTHIVSLRSGCHIVEDMQNDYDEYGDHFKFVVLDTIMGVDEWHKEFDMMRKYQTYNRNYGYNYKDKNAKAKIFIEYLGKKRDIYELCQISGHDYHTLYGRIVTQKWDVEMAMKTPIRAKF